MLNLLFDSAEFTTLAGGTDINTSIPAAGMHGFMFNNITPYYFTVKDDIGNVVASIAPWQTVIGSLVQATQQLQVTSIVKRPSVQVNNVTTSEWSFEYELSINEQQTQVVQSSIAAAANSTVNMAGGTMDVNVTNASVPVTGSVTVASGTLNIGNSPTVSVTGSVDTNTLVINQSTQAVPTQQQSYYGSGIDGAFNPTTTSYANQNNPVSTTTYNITPNKNESDTDGISALYKFTITNTGQSPAIDLWTTNGHKWQAIWQAGDNNLVLYIPGAGAQGWNTSPVSQQANTTYYIGLTIDNDGTTTATLYDVNQKTLGYSQTKTTTLTDVFNGVQAESTAGMTPLNVSVFGHKYFINNTANQADIKNFTSVNIPAGVVVTWANNAEYVCWFVNGDCTINGIIQSANAIPNASTSSQIALFNGNITVSKGGNGGSGGQGGYANASPYHPYAGGSGGTASAYGSGCGGGGGGGSFNQYGGASGGSAGGTGGNGYGSSNGGNGGGNAGNGATNGTAGSSATDGGCATLIIIANGTITINGQILSNGSNGANGGNGGNAGTPGSFYYWGGGGGGGAGAGVNGNGGNGDNGIQNGANLQAPGGGGGGGSGGGSVLLYAAKSVAVNGTINVNGGLGGNAGGAGSGSLAAAAQNGTSGQAGTIKIYQYNNAIAG